MKNYEHVSFHGTFRPYQQNVLDNAKKYLTDNKIHIVAAPGSGKTILGLELIRRLNAPAIIFTPSITIRQQWGERFNEKFLDEGNHITDYVSFNLTDIKLITSVTYQSLHAAFNKITDKIKENEHDDEEIEIDYSNFDLIAEIKRNNIRTICLDEAHHLRSEWEKSLEELITILGDDITIISLTATPPYDSTPGEWKKYTKLCGEIDEEIFVPELVSHGTLCPHQDYIYFNYPTESEMESLTEFKEKIYETLQDILNGQAFKSIIDSVFINYKNQIEFILEHTKEYIALFCLANSVDIEVPKQLLKLVLPKGKLPNFNLHYAEIAFQIMIDNSEYFVEEDVMSIQDTLKENGFILRKRVNLDLTERLKKMEIASIGKLNSIVEIAKAEYQSLNKDLRMLILTDYIKKDMIKFIGTSDMPSELGIVNIFEKIREAVNKEVPLGVLSGTLIIVPNTALDKIEEIAIKDGVKIKSKAIPNTIYSELEFKGSNKYRVNILTRIFELGYINILIGTKSLLGEGWDSPCINSLILASFVGSFMLSNQMRGRAIRIDKNNPNKTSNIWHLATLEPQYIFESSKVKQFIAKLNMNKDELISHDYETLIRRFNGFLAPAYIREVIESGIDRLEIIKPPFDQEGIQNINKKMLELANNREEMRKNWQKILVGNIAPEILEMTEIPKKELPTDFMFINLQRIFYFSILFSIIINSVIRILIKSMSLENFAMNCLFTIAILILLVIGYKKLLIYLSPAKTIKVLGNCILSTLKDIGEIQSMGALLQVDSYAKDLFINCSIKKATIHEKQVFAEAMKELLSSIDNPRYLLIKKGISKLNYKQSFACPSIIGMKKENAEVFKGYLEKYSGNIELIYTRNEKGREYILKCRRWSYINLNEHHVFHKKRLNKWQ